ncbi:DUF1007 family protein [bacterium]|nr:DUF1007 family protein [bacterium]MBU1883070.1 DUF1007 family protein [bacterium]
MKKTFLMAFLFFHTALFGCAACQLMTPTAYVSMKLNMDRDKLKSLHVEWHFNDLFTTELLRQYDKNLNDLLDKKELDSVRKSMVDYVVPKKMLTKISYEFNDKKSTLNPKYKDFAVKIADDRMIFSYNADVGLKLRSGGVLAFVFEDDENYFSFVMHSLDVSKNDLYFSQNLYLFTASLEFKDTPFQMHPSMTKRESKNENKASVENPAQQSLQVSYLQKSIDKIKSLFESIKDDKNPLAYLFLLFFAYAYGLIHALGPGHGKTLVGSYFLSHDRSYIKALFISLAIGVVHTFSAFILTVVIYFLTDKFLAQFVNDTVWYTTKISAFIIVFIAVYLIIKKYKAYKANQESKITKFTFSPQPHVATCGCASCKVDARSTDAALIISAGIIPCPGTVTVFIFSLSLGLYVAGLLSALVMSLGMSTVIFFSALLSVAVRKKTTAANENIKKYLEYASLGVIFILGIVLLLA